jgi:hypothetical protein
MLGGPSKETSSKTGQNIIKHLISQSNYSSSQVVTSYTTTCNSSTKAFPVQSKKSTSGTGNSSLQTPTEKSSLSDESDGPELDSDTKRMEEDELNAIKFDVSLFWKLENFANLDGADAVEPNNRFDRFEDEITRFPDGRYCTPLPWTADQWRLQRNFHLTAGRLESTLARLRKTPHDLTDYSYEIQQLIEKKFVEEADMEYDGHHMYVPNHPVFRRDKTRRRFAQFLMGQLNRNLGQA